jgi:transcriptional regulator with XRE-family HTH domain
MIAYNPRLLKEARIRAGLTQEQAARAMGIPCVRTFGNWENGCGAPTLRHVPALESVLGRPISCLFEEVREVAPNVSHKDCRRTQADRPRKSGGRGIGNEG